MSGATNPSTPLWKASTSCLPTHGMHPNTDRPLSYLGVAADKCSSVSDPNAKKLGLRPVPERRESPADVGASSSDAAPSSNSSYQNLLEIQTAEQTLSEMREQLLAQHFASSVDRVRHSALSAVGKTLPSLSHQSFPGPSCERHYTQVRL